MSLIGRSVKRLEDRPLLTGSGRFAADVTVPDMLYMRVVRSPVAFGRLTGLQIAEALAHPGTVGVWTAQDVADIPPIGFRMTPVPGLEPYRQPVLANGHVRYVGEPVAAGFAADTYMAEDIADLVAPEIEPLTPCLDPAASPSEFAPGRNTEAAVITKAYGDLDAAFAGAHAVVALELTHRPAQRCAPRNPRNDRRAGSGQRHPSDVWRYQGAALQPSGARHHARAAARPDSPARRACRRGLWHSRRALSRGRFDLCGGVAARAAGQVDRGPLRASGGGEPVERLGPSGARGGRRARLHSGPRRRVLVRPGRLPPHARCHRHRSRSEEHTS